MSQKNLSELFNHISSLDEKSRLFLSKALENNDMPGFDYIEFKQALRALEKLNMPIQTSYQSAFATASTVGLTKERLVETIDYYKKILSKEKGQFDVALKNQMQQRVASKKEEMTHLQQKIQQQLDQIKRLQDQIGQFQNQIKNIESQVNSASDKIAATKANFERTFEEIIKDIDADKVKVIDYL